MFFVVKMNTRKYLHLKTSSTFFTSLKTHGSERSSMIKNDPKHIVIGMCEEEGRKKLGFKSLICVLNPMTKWS